MRVLAEREAVLTEFEVRELLLRQAEKRAADEKQRPLPGARRTATSGAAGARSWRTQEECNLITEQVLENFSGNSCSLQSRETIAAFLAAVQPYELTRAEILMLTNTQPRSLVEIHLIVEECEERLTPEQRMELLNLCQTLVDPQLAAARNGDVGNGGAG